MNKIESMMKILFDGDKPRLMYSNKLVGRNDMINRTELYTMIAKDIVSEFEKLALVIKVKDYAQMKDKTIMTPPDNVTYPYRQYVKEWKLGKFREQGVLDKWLKYTGYEMGMRSWNDDVNCLLYNTVCSILRNSYVIAHSSTKHHPIALLERRAKHSVKESITRTNKYFKPILIACDHKQIGGWEWDRFMDKKKDEEREIKSNMHKEMMSINDEIIVDRSTIMCSIHDMEEYK
jgi:hypothetical protein